MKTIITSLGNSQESIFDQRFGRAAWFCLYDEEHQQLEFIENSNADIPGGAGTKTAELMVELGVSKIISGDFGPKAKKLLDQFNIQMVIYDGEGKCISTIIDSIKR